MPERVVVANAGPLIALSSINRLDLLKLLFGSVHIPQAVYREVVTMGGGRPGETEVRRADWIKRMTVKNTEMVNIIRDRLDPGESESIVLASELGADYVILDERLARRKAGLIGLRFIGTLGVMVMAKQAGFIDNLEPLLDELAKTPFRMSDAIRSLILQRAEA